MLHVIGMHVITKSALLIRYGARSESVHIRRVDGHCAGIGVEGQPKANRGWPRSASISSNLRGRFILKLNTVRETGCIMTSNVNMESVQTVVQ